MRRRERGRGGVVNILIARLGAACRYGREVHCGFDALAAGSGREGRGRAVGHRGNDTLGQVRPKTGFGGWAVPVGAEGGASFPPRSTARLIYGTRSHTHHTTLQTLPNTPN
jgi:hypothetical protein